MERELEQIKDQAIDFFKLVRLTTPGLEQVKLLMDQGCYEEALYAYRSYFIVKMSKYKLRKRGELQKDVDEMMQLNRKIRWLTADYDFHFLFQEQLELLDIWKQTRDAAYLQKWLFIAADFAVHNKRDYDQLSKEQLAFVGAFNPMAWTWDGFHAPWRAESIFKGLQEICVNLDDSEYDLLPVQELTVILTSLATDHAYYILTDDRGHHSNQYFSNGICLTIFSELLQEFEGAQEWRNTGRNRIEQFMLDNVLPDGGDIEPSFNYNLGLSENIIYLLSLFSTNVPEWVLKLKLKAVQRMSLFAGLLMPTGGLPRIGTYTSIAPPAIWRMEERHMASWKHTLLLEWQVWLKHFADAQSSAIFEHILGDGENVVEALDFTSMAYPYSGYYAMRSGWGNEDLYLFMMASRMGRGHAVENQNSIAITAFGRDLITDKGPKPYFLRFLEDDQKADFDKISQYYTHSFGHNTVIVDGHSQRRLRNRHQVNWDQALPTYQTPISGKWHSSPLFDYTEGNYSDGYGNDEATRIDVKHHRQVIFVKSAGLWIITDQMQSDERHLYSQTWNLKPPHIYPEVPQQGIYSPGFTPQQVWMDENCQTIRTLDEDGPNISLFHFTPTPMKYTMYYGSKEPFMGWYSSFVRGRSVPNVNLHCNWEGEGEQMAVTVILPIKNKSQPLQSIRTLCQHTDQTFCGFEMIMDSGVTIRYQASLKPKLLSGMNVTAVADVLLTVENERKEVAGLVLNGQEMARTNKPLQQLETPSFEFSFAWDSDQWLETAIHVR